MLIWFLIFFFFNERRPRFQTSSCVYRLYMDYIICHILYKLRRITIGEKKLRKSYLCGQDCEIRRGDDVTRNSPETTDIANDDNK